MKSVSMGAVHPNWSWKPDGILPSQQREAQAARRRAKRGLPPKPPQEKDMTPKRKVARKTTTKLSKPEADPNLVPLKQLCGTAIDPRDARRVLRKANIAGHDSRDRWTFKKGSAALDKAREILNSLR